MGRFLRPTKPDRLLTLSAALIVFAAADITRADADLWGHLRFGLDYLRDWRIPTIDPYSFTQDVPWVNHEWLSEAQMALAWTIGRSVGLSLLKALLVFVVLAVVWTSLRSARLWVRVTAVVWLFFGTIHMWATLRPQLWTFVAFALLCRALVSTRRAIVWWLPPLFALWANWHGGWIVGIGVLSAWGTGCVIRRPEELFRWGLLVVVCFAATAINPYGWSLWMFMIRTVHMTRSISEWGSLWGTPWINWLPWFAGIALVAWIAALGRRLAGVRERPPVLFVLVMLAFAAARVMRIESLFVTACLLLGAPFIAARWPSRPAPDELRRALRAVAVPAAITAVAVALAIVWRTAGCLVVFGDWAPDAAVGHALDSAPSGRLVTYFDWGEFAIWHFGPRLKVSIDGRRETVYSDTRLAEQDAILAGRPAGLRALALSHAEYVWLPASSDATRVWLVSNGYRIDVSSLRSFIAVRSDLPVVRIQGHPAPADCFPE